MGAIREDQKENTSKFFNVFWTQLVKPYYNPEETDAWWNELIKRVGDIGHEYCEKDPRLRKILIGFEAGLEEVRKNERGRQTK